MQAIHPTVAIVSNGRRHGHPRRVVIENQILSLTPPPTVFITNRNDQPDAWQPDDIYIADLDTTGVDGMIEIGVWRRTYRVWRWRDGERIDTPGVRFRIKQR